MNDFTKEELTDLHYAIRFFWKNRASYDLPCDEEDFTKSYELKEKLKSMIYNYCNHEWVNGTYCEKCNRSHTE